MRSSEQKLDPTRFGFNTLGTSLSNYNFFVENSRYVEKYETEYMFNLDPDLTDEGMLLGHVMAEN
jgi:hypothetical protein